MFWVYMHTQKIWFQSANLSVYKNANFWQRSCNFHVYYMFNIKKYLTKQQWWTLFFTKLFYITNYWPGLIQYLKSFLQIHVTTMSHKHTFSHSVLSYNVKWYERRNQKKAAIEVSRKAMVLFIGVAVFCFVFPFL